MNPMPETLVTLAELVAEGFGASVHAAPNIETLADQLTASGHDVRSDDIGRRCVTREVARQLFASRAEAQQRDAAEAAERGSHMTYADAVRRGMIARAEKQRALLREYPNMPAAELMALTNGSADRKLAAAGRRFDSYVNAANNGVDGYGQFGRIPNGD